MRAFEPDQEGTPTSPRRLVGRLVPPGSRRRRAVARSLALPMRDLLVRLRIRGRRMMSDAGSPATARPRLLFVLHEAPGGTRETTLDLASALDPSFECFLLEGSPWRLSLSRATPHGIEPLARHWLSRPWSQSEDREAEHSRIYTSLLERLDPAIVHVRHLLGHTDDLVDLCEQRRLPIVLSFHDFYMACPGIHLIDDLGHYCAGRCTPSRGQCRIPISWLAGLPVLKQGYLESWRRRVGGLLPRVAAFVTTSQSTSDVLLDVYPQLVGSDFRVIAHGRDFAEQLDLADPPEVGRPVRIALLGHLHPHKGSELARRLVEYDRARENRLELHFFGTTDPALRGYGIDHGPYDRAKLADHLATVRPSFVGIFSLWPETYCHTLTEAWSLGIPVLTTDLGAQAERVRTGGGGWTVPVDDVPAIYREILRIVSAPDEYHREASRARHDPERTVAWMGRQYEELYRSVLATAPRLASEEHPRR